MADYDVAALSKSIPGTAGRNSRIGNAWKNPNGTISIKLYPFVVLPGGPDTIITLFPADRSGEAAEDIKAEIPF